MTSHYGVTLWEVHIKKNSFQRLTYLQVMEIIDLEKTSVEISATKPKKNINSNP